MWAKIKVYVISAAIALGVGALSAAFTGGNMQMYENLRLPALAPPAWLFPVVWTILFILMGVGAAIVYKSNAKNRSAALEVYALQLIVNFFWTLIFFNMQAYLFAFLWLLLLWILIAVMIWQFWKISKTAALLQLPYFLWVTFAGYLTLMVYILNK